MQNIRIIPRKFTRIHKQAREQMKKLHQNVQAYHDIPHTHTTCLLLFRSSFVFLYVCIYVCVFIVVVVVVILTISMYTHTKSQQKLFILIIIVALSSIRLESLVAGNPVRNIRITAYCDTLFKENVVRDYFFFCIYYSQIAKDSSTFSNTKKTVEIV